MTSDGLKIEDSSGTQGERYNVIGFVIHLLLIIVVASLAISSCMQRGNLR